MQDIALIPGAARKSGVMHPMQARDDASIHPIDYQRGSFRSDPSNPVLSQYSERVFEELRNLDRPVDVYLWSMAGPIGCGLMQLEAESPGLIRNYIFVNPGVFGGPPDTNFHLESEYTRRLATEAINSSVRHIHPEPIAEAVARIQKEIPGFRFNDFLIQESLYAIKEAGDGVMHIPEDFDRSRILFFRTSIDHVIPPEVSSLVAERSGLQPIVLEGWGHELPLLDTEGVTLKQIRKASNKNSTKKKIN